MDSIIHSTRQKFIALILLVVLLLVGSMWGALQFYNRSEIAKPADSSEVHSSAEDNDAFAAYLEEEKAFEAHFVTLASSIKEQESDRVTQALAFTAIGAIMAGTVIAYVVARKLMQPVEEAYQSQERFLQDAAHELRNPLAAMTVALQQAEKTGQKSALLTTFKRQTNRLVNINEDLLFLERKANQPPTQLNISGLLEEVVEELQPLASKKKIALNLKTEASLSKTMSSSDYVRLVKNIIDNAIKYSTPKSAVSITQKKHKDAIHITVKDHGIGIPKKDLSQVGSRFFRSGNTGNIEGTGLGLAIAHKILNTYGGSIQIQSQVNKGTTVELKLPA